MVAAKPAQQVAIEATPESMDMACGRGSPHEPGMTRPWEERATHAWPRNGDLDPSNRDTCGASLADHLQYP